MSEINKIGLPKLDNTVHSAKNKKESLATGKEFENQLLETVQKLKTMDSEVNAMMETTSPKNASSIDLARHKHHRRDIAAENFTAANKSSEKSAKFVALQYEQNKTNKS